MTTVLRFLRTRKM
jgi:hypothetical protein